MLASAAAGTFIQIKKRPLGAISFCPQFVLIDAATECAAGKQPAQGLAEGGGVSADGVGFGVAVGVGESGGSGEVDGSGEPEGSGVRLGSTVGVGDGVMTGIGVGFSGRLMVPFQSPCAMAYS